MNVKPIFASSVNPTALAMTFKGLIPLIIFGAAYFGVNLETNELTEIITQVGLVVSGCVTLFGLGRKLFVKFK